MMGEIQEKTFGSVTVLTVGRGLRGPLEGELRQRIEALVAAGRLQIVINLGMVPYIDSSDIGRLIRAHLAVRQGGGRVRLCNLSERVLSVLQITRLDTVLDLYPTEEEALANIRDEADDHRPSGSKKSD